MKCGYCGNSICPSDDTQSTQLLGLVISQFVYDSCDHLTESIDGGESHPWQGLSAVKALVDSQLKSIERLEMYLVDKKDDLISSLRDFCLQNKAVLRGCQKAAESFGDNFKRMLSIRVEPAFREKFQPNLQAYFNREELTAWANTCLKESARLIRKLDSLDQTLTQDVSQEVDRLRAQISVITQPLKNKLNLNEITYKAFERSVNKPDAKSINGEHLGAIKTLQDIYKSLHVQVQSIIKLIVGDVAAFAKRTDAALSRNQYLLDNSVAEISKDSKILAIFEDFDDIFIKCIEEIKQRSKFRFVYKRVLQILNELTKAENARRSNFMQQYSSKIPSQIFPEIRKLSKEIVLEKFLEGVDEELPIETALSQKLLEGLQNVRVLILAL
jgi:hypothetical protein